MSFDREMFLRRKEISGVMVVSDDSFVMELDSDSVNYSHNFVGVVFYSNEEGTAQVTPTAGTVTISAELENLPGIYEEVNNGAQSADTPQTATFSGNPVSLKVVLDSIAGATHFQIILVQNNA